MRRKYDKDKLTDINSTGDIKRDLPEKQLAAYGAAALAYNILEDEIDALLYVVTNVPDWLAKEVSSRIHGLDGKTAIIQKAIEKSALDAADQKTAKEAVAEFGEFKKIRDAMIHTRIIDASIGIGLSDRTRGDKAFEVLLSQEALDTLYDHIAALEKELSSLGSLLGAANTLKNAAPDDPNRARYEEAIGVHQAQFRENHRRRRSLKPLPKFPTESELNAAVIRMRDVQTGILMGWFQPWTMPQQRPGLNPGVAATTTGSTLPPLPLRNSNATD
jgi:hypothetical protein